MNSLIPANFAAPSSRFANVPVIDELSSGIQSSFGLIGYKGKVWSIRYRGEDTPLMREDGDGPKSSIEVVVLKASTSISKIWYEQGYVEGSNAAPDCFSNNGVTPEVTSAKKQCESCAVCPHNQWGSRITPAGKQGKACSDSKRLAVVPVNDINNDLYGGPMLLRVPAASLQDVAMYGQKMAQLGYPAFSVATKIAFDPAESYPKFVFSALRPLSDDEADIVLGLRDSHSVQRILSENEFAVSPAGGGDQPIFEQAPDVGAKAQPSVGEQARQVAAQQAEAVAKAKAEAAAAERATQEEFAAKARAQQEKANKAKEAAAKKAEAAAAKEAAEAVPEESDEERELREMEEAMFAKKAALAAKKAEQEKAALAAAKPEAKVEKVTEPEETNVASAFEQDLDSMLNDLLP